jgi:hypothetical protein
MNPKAPKYIPGLKAIPEEDEDDSKLIPGKNVFIIYDKNKFLKTVININSKEVVTLIDTGAARSLIAESLVKSLNVVVEFNNISLDVVGQSSVPCVGSCILPVIISGVPMSNHEFLVYPDHNCANNSIILGVDFLITNKLEVCIKERKLVKHLQKNSSIDIYFDESGEIIGRNIKNLICYANSDVKIPPNTILPVMVKVSDFVDETQVFCYDDELLDPKLSGKVQGVSGICKLHELSVLVSTATDSVKIRKGQVLGSVSSLLEIPEEDITQTTTWTAESIRHVIKLKLLTDSEQQKVYEMVQTCAGVLSTGDNDIGHAAVTKHKIKLYDDTPIYQRPRRFAGPLADEIERQCYELSTLDVVEPSNSPYSSPVVPVRKKDGTVRLCIDYRKLNRVTIPDKFPVPNLTDSIFGLKGNVYFTTLDMVKGYYQIPLDEESRKYTAFSTQRNHWQFKRLSFGLCNAPASFQREIQAVLAPFPSSKVIAYLDDILIMGRNFEEHLDLVGKVLTTLQNYSMKIKPSKCTWFANQVEYLGHLVSEQGIKKTEKYTNSVENYPKPETVGQLREFLGFINFQRKYVPNCSVIQKPLSCLSGGKKTKLLNWTSDMEEAFSSLKTEMAADIQLAYPDYTDVTNRLQLWVDASATGAGAYLAQLQEEKHRVIGFASMAFTPNQMNYSTLERELTALRWGVKTFKPFIMGISFIIFTDHQPIVHLHNMKLICSRLTRTVQELSEYNFDLRYVPGKENCAADALSRVQSAPHIPTVSEDGVTPALPEGLVLDGAAAPGGGDSLFISLHKALSRLIVCDLPKSHIKLRETIIDEVLQDPGKYQLKLDRDSRKRLKLMRFSEQLPSLELLLVVSNLFKVNVLMYFGDVPVSYQFDHYEREIFLQCLGGVHFNPLIELKDSKLPPVLFSNLVTCNSQSSRVLYNDYVAECENDEECDGGMDSLFKFDNHKTCEHGSLPQPQVYLKIDNFRFCAVLDTGSEISLVSQEVVDILKNSDLVKVEGKFERVCDIIGLTGFKIPITRTVNLEFVFGKTNCKYKFAVVPPNVIPHCFLIGIDMLALYNIDLDFDKLVCRMDGDIINYFHKCNRVALIAECILSTTCEPVASHQVKLTETNSDVRLEIAGSSNTVTGLSLLFDLDQLRILQSKDQLLRTLKKYIANSVPVKSWKNNCKIFSRYLSKLFIRDNVLYYNPECPIYVASQSILIDLSLLLHLQFAHIGRDKVLHLLFDLIWHPLKYKIVSEITTCCPQCQFLKISSHVSPPILKICTSYPFELLAIDLVSLPVTKRGNIGLVTVVDHYSKWVQAIPIKNKTCANITKLVKEIIFPSLLKLPSTLMSDNGGEFAGSDFANMLAELGVKQRFVTPMSPSSNGAIERVNRTIINFLRGLTQQGDDWDLKLHQAVISYNNSYHTEIKLTPSSCLLTKSHISSIPQIDTVKLTDKWTIGHKNFTPFKIKQFVLQKISVKNHLNINKLSLKYRGPFEIIRVNSNDVTYLLRDLVTNSHVRAHHRDLIHFKYPPGYLRNHPWFEDVMSKFMQGDFSLLDVDNNINPDSKMCKANRCELLQDSSDTSEREVLSASEGSSTEGTPLESDVDSVLDQDVVAPHQLERVKLKGLTKLKCKECELEEWLDLKALHFDSPAGDSCELLGGVRSAVALAPISYDHLSLPVVIDPDSSRELSVGVVTPDHIDDNSNVSCESFDEIEEYFDSVYSDIFGSDEAASEEVESSFSHTNNGLEPVHASTPVELCTHATRSRGPVGSLPNVQPLILERKIVNRRV